MAHDFNSRPREGANAIFVVAAEMYDISIPAPARGRTDTIRALSALIEFQFPPPRGGELLAYAYRTIRHVFQFPPPRGGERGETGARGQQTDFNSRPREGAN